MINKAKAWASPGPPNSGRIQHARPQTDHCPAIVIPGSMGGGSGTAKPGSQAAPPAGGCCAGRRWSASRRLRRPLLAPPWPWRGLSPPGRAEATTDFPTALARHPLTAYSCEHLHNDDIFNVGAALSYLDDAGFDVWIEWLNACLLPQRGPACQRPIKLPAGSRTRATHKSPSR
jgi:hypothetical protein